VTGDMPLNPGNDNKMDIYHNLDDGRIVELRIGRLSDCDDAIWARNLSAREKEIYLQLKQMGSSDMDIYCHLNQPTASDLSSRS
jgi:hypothetical protein